MSLFSKSLPEPEREPSVEIQLQMREAELLAEIRRLDSQLDTLRSLLQTFRSEHTILISGQIAFKVADISERDGLAAQWSALLSQLGEVGRARDKALHDWSELCSNPKETSHHGD
jgi:hypothetical protein